MEGPALRSTDRWQTALSALLKQGNTALTIAEKEDEDELVAVLREATNARAGKARR